jgi:oxygen-independent coproporphyrinogen-3 oxidase
LGVSAISSLENVYAQNRRELPSYYEAIDNGHSPVMRGLRVTPEDKLRRAVINRILCHGALPKAEVEEEFGIEFDSHFAPEIVRLRELEQDQLLRLDREAITVTTLGRIFMRNVAMVFDARLNLADQTRRQTFSRTL